MGDVYDIFYSPEKVLSYGRPFIFSVGSRSIGKSTGWAIYMIDRFVKKGWQWLYTRRDETELDITRKNFYDEGMAIFNAFYGTNHRVVYRGEEYYVDGELAGFTVPLNLQQKYKSGGKYSGVRTILYDEFIITPGSGAKYIGGRAGMMQEVDAALSLYQSVDRGIGKAFRNETTFVFTGNAGSYYNPFFIEYGVDRYLRPDTKYLAPKSDSRDRLWVLESTKETEATKVIQESYAYQLSTERTRRYAYENKYDDMKESDFIMKEPHGKREPMCNIVYEGEEYVVYSFINEGFIWVGRGSNSIVPTLAITTSDHRPNYLLIQHYRGHYATQMIKQMYDLGCIKFQNMKCKLVIDFYLKYDV